MRAHDIRTNLLTNRHRQT